MKRISYYLALGMLLICSALSHAASVSWDGTSSDITSLGANVNSTPRVWTTADSVWNTTDEIVSAVGGQASFKSAIGIVPGDKEYSLERKLECKAQIYT